MTLAAWDTSRSTYLFIVYLMGAYDEAIAAAQRALALASASGDVALQLLANLHLGIAYQTKADYRRAIDCLSQTLTTVDSHERFGEYILAVFTPAYLAACHAELGTFAEGRSVGDEGLRIAEAVDHPMSLTFALWGMRSVGPPPGRPLPGSHPAGAGRAPLSGHGPACQLSFDGCGLGRDV